ncbi:hypothetical protein L486_01096 [Kwoniella mangroviensis CBS 10435]|uniref:PAS domain-containing protein n=1 Tax=Kwoniella mangroviensis CBS 10435 TaxID=1331196 RepID=A0A1B9J0Z9_9TREE|nr:hypothetical protein L486_01096 [Kwoniella mangroviensis CBS 10435]
MSISPDQGTDEVWDLLDALERYNSALDVEELDDGEMASLEEALAYDPTSRPIASRASSGVLDNEQIEVPHFPDLSERLLANVRKGEARTSEPISTGVLQSEESALVDMASKARFEELLGTQMGLTRFEEWINHEGLPGSKELMRYYKDLRAYMTLFKEVQAIGSGMQEVYSEKTAHGHGPVDSSPVRTMDYTSGLKSASLSLRSAQQAATESLYAAEFRRFVAGKLTEQARARLQFIPDHDKRGNLGEVFCEFTVILAEAFPDYSPGIADPRLPDQPLVYISDGFCRLSEYSRDLLIGRNCRFLQGPKTDKSSIRALRDAIEEGREHCCLLLNYTRTGKPFWNLLNMIPLRGVNGAAELLLGAQIDVTSAISSSKAFKNLEDLVDGKGVEDRSANAFGFSDELLVHAEKHLSTPSIGRQLQRPPSSVSASTTPSLPYPGPTAVTQRYQTSSPKIGSPQISQDRRSSWISKFKKRTDVPISMTSNIITTNGNAATPQIPARLRDRISDLSAAHAKLIIFDAKCGRIQYVTPPLLAYLRYPIRKRKDRLASSLLRMDIVDLLTGETPSETNSIIKSIDDIVSNESTHSVFAGLLLFQSGRDAPDHIADAVTEGGKRYARSLLHLTPVKDRRDKSQLYVVVVG